MFITVEVWTGDLILWAQQTRMTKTKSRDKPSPSGDSQLMEYNSIGFLSYIYICYYGVWWEVWENAVFSRPEGQTSSAHVDHIPIVHKDNRFPRVV